MQAVACVATRGHPSKDVDVLRGPRSGGTVAWNGGTVAWNGDTVAWNGGTVAWNGAARVRAGGPG